VANGRPVEFASQLAAVSLPVIPVLKNLDTSRAPHLFGKFQRGLISEATLSNIRAGVH